MKFLLNENSLLLNDTEDALPISQLTNIPKPPLNPNYAYDRELQSLTSGKQLLPDDLPYSLEKIHEHYENGHLTYRAGIFLKNKHAACVRCGNQDKTLFAQFPCARCSRMCTYCRKCIMMGRVTECTPLLGWCGPEPEQEIPTEILTWKGSLSEGQAPAADRVVTAINNNDELLVWAVCGAGKTEIIFKGMEAALSKGKRICLATPRTDVVLELTPRLKAAFPNTPIASLYGGSEDRHLYAPLTIATTHQLMRFYEAFDALILDEVDAFPYTVEEALKLAVKNARKPQSSMIYLTATPNQKWQRECRTGKRNFITIPARFHRHPLPVPKAVWCGNWKKPMAKGRLPHNVTQWIKSRLKNQKLALVFFPHITLMEKVLPFLQSLHPDIAAVNAEDPERKEKVLKMRRKEIPLLLTTTILERGVTFPNIDVAVVGADDDVFTESALVQIAGRVGRSVDFPDGDITFFHYGQTVAMEKAKYQIQKMNREARRKGLVQ